MLVVWKKPVAPLTPNFPTSCPFSAISVHWWSCWWWYFKEVMCIDPRLELVCPFLAWFANILQTLQKFCIMHSWQRVDTDWGFATLARPHSLLMCLVHLIGHSSGRLMSHQDTQKCYIIIEILYYLCHTECSAVCYITPRYWGWSVVIPWYRTKQSSILHQSKAVYETKFEPFVTLT